MRWIHLWIWSIKKQYWTYLWGWKSWIL